jgi:hypothetical protein
MIRALEIQRKTEERERQKEEKRMEKKLIKERKLEQKRREMILARELKKPVEDMVLRDAKVHKYTNIFICLIMVYVRILSFHMNGKHTVLTYTMDMVPHAVTLKWLPIVFVPFIQSQHVVIVVKQYGMATAHLLYYIPLI